MLVNWKKEYTFLNLNILMQNFNVDKKKRNNNKTHAIGKKIFQIRFRLCTKFIQNEIISMIISLITFVKIWFI